MNKLFGVNLKDQNGIRYDPDHPFGAERLRQSFHQVKLLMEQGYGTNGEYVGFDAKPKQTTLDKDAYEHRKTFIQILEALEKKVETYDYDYPEHCIRNQDYESLERYPVLHLMGIA